MNSVKVVVWSMKRRAKRSSFETLDMSRKSWLKVEQLIHSPHLNIKNDTVIWDYN